MFSIILISCGSLKTFTTRNNETGRLQQMVLYYHFFNFSFVSSFFMGWTWKDNSSLTGLTMFFSPMFLMLKFFCVSLMSSWNFMPRAFFPELVLSYKNIFQKFLQHSSLHYLLFTFKGVAYLFGLFHTFFNCYSKCLMDLFCLNDLFHVALLHELNSF